MVAGSGEIWDNCNLCLSNYIVLGYISEDQLLVPSKFTNRSIICLYCLNGFPRPILAAH